MIFDSINSKNSIKITDSINIIEYISTQIFWTVETANWWLCWLFNFLSYVYSTLPLPNTLFIKIACHGAVIFFLPWLPIHVKWDLTIYNELIYHEETSSISIHTLKNIQDFGLRSKFLWFSVIYNLCILMILLLLLMQISK